jgi:CBS-domain-containing membrane protein
VRAAVHAADTAATTHHAGSKNLPNTTSPRSPLARASHLDVQEGKTMPQSAARQTEKPTGLMPRLTARFPERLVWTGFMFVNGFISIAVLATISMLSKAPFIFPSLGASAILVFYRPSLPAASPKNVVFGHAIGIVCGFAALVVTGLQHSPSAIATGVDGPRVIALALSLAATGALMVFFKVMHPPAGATALVISLGVFTKLYQLPVMELAVIVLALQALFVNKVAGVDYPTWAARTPPLHS